MSVYFHGTFGLNRSHMAKLLKLSLENPSWQDSQLAEPFGYKAPFAAKVRTWLHYTGITEPRLPVELTSFGNTIYRYDKGLDKIPTLWFMHWTLIESPDRAANWHFFFHEFLPSNRIFTRETLLDALAAKLKVHSEVHFGRNKPMTMAIARKLIECYTLDEALGTLGMLTATTDSKYKSSADIRALGPWSSTEDLAAAYRK